MSTTMDAAGNAIDLWLPDLSRFAPGHPVLSLLARADRLGDGPRGYLDGAAQRFGIDGAVPAGALTRQFMASDAGDASWLCADPAWVQPDLNGARLLAFGRMQLSAEDAEALAQPLRPVFEEAGMTLQLSSPEHWHVRLPDGVPLPAFAAPEQALGEDLYHHLPQGAEGRRWRILLNDVQVILHQHAINATRRDRGLPPVNHLWLWGGGRLPSNLSTRLKRVVSDDVLLGALAQRAGAAHASRTLDTVAAATPDTLVDLQDLPAQDIGATWFPAIASLAQRQAVRLSLSSGERWLHRPWHRLRFWRGGAR